jgi:hypothetical protein
MKIDVLEFLAIGQSTRSKSARGEAKADSADIITAIDASGYGQWKHVKNLQGWPWDLKLYDKEYVYDWITEGPNGWSPDPIVGPRSFKKFIQNHYNIHGVLVDGLPIFPRYVDSVENFHVTDIPSNLTTYATFENCKQQGTSVPLGAVTHRLTGPFQINHGGDVATQPTLIHQYYWSNNGVPTLEENYYALSFGWVSWKLQQQNLTTGLYEIVQITSEPNIYSVADVKIIFPCF